MFKADQLRAEGFKVFGGGELNYNMEKDRNFAMKLVKQAGIDILPYREFSDPESGMEYLLANPEKSFVFKPDKGEGAYTTYVPDNERDEDANEELVRYMQALPDDGTTYILQERIKGLEYNVEAWIYKGKPFFAFCDLECKRKLNKDEGELVGCAQSVCFAIPLDSRVLENTIYKLLPYMPKDYTGPLDMNLITKDKKDYFIEFCARMGYNAHPNLVWNLTISSMSEVWSDWMDGKIDDFYRHFRHGFGGAVTLYIDHKQPGLPFDKYDALSGHFYHYDTYQGDDDEFFLSGYGNEIGIVMGYGYTIKECAKDTLEFADRIHYPMHACRTDLDETDYLSNPQSRYDGLIAMNYLEPEK